MVHGACHGAWCWDNWMDALPILGWHCYAIALRNHPGSFEVDDETYRTGTSIADYVADVSTLTRFIGIPSVMIGHSMGGIVVQKYVERRFSSGTGEMGMILLASAPPGELGPLRENPVPTDVAFLSDPAAAKKYFFSQEEGEIQEKAVSQLVPESPSVVNEYSLSPGVEIDTACIRCPVLVVSAENDHTVAPSDDRIARYYGAQYHFAAGIGHDLMIETGWEMPLAAVTAWLKSHFSIE